MPEMNRWSDGTPIVTPFDTYQRDEQIGELLEIARAAEELLDVLPIAVPSLAVRGGRLRHLLREYRVKRGELTRPLVDVL